MIRPRSILGVAVVSAAGLAFEITLTRLFAIQQFHHFAFVVVSLAVLASAASGLLVTVRRRHASPAVLSAALGAAILLAYAVINWLPFDSYNLAWDGTQVVILAVYFLAAGVPFVMVGWIVAIGLTTAGGALHRVYAANLIGAALGCAGALILLSSLPPEGVVLASAAAAFLGSSCFPARRSSALAAGTAAVLCLVAMAASPSWLSLRLSPYKPLSAARLAQGAQLTISDWSASARLDVVEGPGIHVLPGLSLLAPSTLPVQAALFLDGDGPIPLTAAFPSDPLIIDLAGRLPAALVYRLRPGARTLLLDPGAGLDALMALGAGAAHVSLPTDEPLVDELLRGRYGRYTRELIMQPQVEVLPRSSRGALQLSGAAFDVVQFCLSDPYHPVSSGAFSLAEDFTLTVEAIEQALDRLAPDGVLVLTRWLQTPPSESIRALTTILAALDRAGIERPAEHLIAFRSMRTATILVALRAWQPEEIAVTRNFMEQNAYDPMVFPGLTEDEVNRFNRLPEDRYHALAASLLTDPSSTVAGYEFNLAPATDDRPFFFHFFRWRQTPAVLAGLGRTWQPFGGSGYLVLMLLLGLMLAISLPLVIIPLWLLRRIPPSDGRRSVSNLAPGWARLGVYFSALGAGYLLVEVPLIQRLTLLLDRPTLTAGVVLSVLLLASGIGSQVLAPRLRLRPALAALTLTLCLTALALPGLIELGLGWSLAARLLLASAAVFPAGLLMGVPFAAGLRKVEARAPSLLPWAWGVNGASSGVGGVLAATLALDAGLTAALLAGAGAYLVAHLAAPDPA